MKSPATIIICLHQHVVKSPDRIIVCAYINMLNHLLLLLYALSSTCHQVPCAYYYLCLHQHAVKYPAPNIICAYINTVKGSTMLVRSFVLAAVRQPYILLAIKPHSLIHFLTFNHPLTQSHNKDGLIWLTLCISRKLSLQLALITVVLME